MVDAFAVPGYARVYVLGCFASRVTFYSQQVRALNLVDALCKSAIVRSGQEVAVVGAGAAGLTAAAALAKRGARVRLFEKRASPATEAGRIPIQRSSRQRVLHPHLYDWPWGETPTAPQAGLPLLDWNVGDPRKVMAGLEAALLKVRDETGDRAGPRIAFHDEAGSPRIARATRSSVTLELGARTNDFAAVILAVGFGVEEIAETGWHSYWADDSLDSFEAAKGKWLISGFGDGALTDLLRLCTVNFDHNAVIDKFLGVVPERTRDDLRGLENDDATVDRTQDLEAAARVFEKRLSLELRGVEVYLNCTKSQLFGSTTSVLNRLMVASLLLKAKGSVRFLANPGKIVTPATKDPDGRCRVLAAASGEPIPEGPFDGVVVRHGPRKALELDFPEIWKACEKLTANWRATPPAADWTRKPCWQGDEYGRAPPLVRDFDGSASCVIITSESRDGSIAADTSNAILRATELDKLRFRGKVFDAAPVELLAEQALSSPASYEHAVRTICGAQLAVFDLGDDEPGVALLLGIRAVARRGVTLVVRRGALDSQSWDALPFNLREISIVHRAEGDKTFIARLRKALVEGSKLLGALPESYLDLPAFDSIRRLGFDPSMYRAIAPEKQALVLSWFDKQYLAQGGMVLTRSLETTLGDDCNVLNLMTATSPQLTSQKLYAELRRSDLCVVDWTGFRQNVFFELGVRLAANRLGALSFVCDEPQLLKPQVRKRIPVEGKQHQALRTLFAPTGFGLSSDEKVRSRIDEHRQEIRLFKTGRQLVARAGASLPDGYTYALVRDSLDHADEPWSIGVVQRLTNAARELLGPDIKTYPDSPMLFDDVGKEDAWRTAMEHLIGAWYYLERRHGVVRSLEAGKIAADDPALADLLRLSREIRETMDALGWREAPEYAEVAAAIKGLLARTRSRERRMGSS
jgi:hypothetical protein